MPRPMTGEPDAAGDERRRATTARTTPPHRTVKAALSPGDGAVVGVGMPVVVRLDAAVHDPGAVGWNVPFEEWKRG
jgi:predicted NBD/HSP70 family sugar kinase